MQIIYYKRKQQPLIFKLALPYSSDISNTRILRALWASWLRPLCLWLSGRVTHAPYPSDKQAHFMDEHLKRPNIRHVCTSDGVENVGNEHKNKAILGVGREYQIWVSSLWNRVYTHNWPSPIYPFSICTDIYAPLVKQIGLCKHNILFGMACTRTLWYNCCIHSF